MSEEQSPKGPRDSSRREFIKIGLTAVAGAALTGAATISLLGPTAKENEETISSLQQQLTSAQQQTSQLKTTLGTMQGFLTLNSDEQSLVEAIVETIIPSDQNGPGAKEAGVVYFIDRQLAGDYGKSGNMFMQGPFVLAGQKGPITVDGVVYPGGTPNVRVGAGTRYQYFLNMREFWRVGLQALQAYSTSNYGGPFESLSSDKRAQVLSDLWGNKPTGFSGLIPMDFAYELFFMAWSGFLMDPLYGGNMNMAGWDYVGFNGTNSGNFYGEGYTPQQLMTATSPTKLKPASLSQLQQKLGLIQEG
jgi:gluconate 2-dehydrogenase gamma chain